MNAHTNNLLWSVNSEPLIQITDDETWPSGDWFRQYQNVKNTAPIDAQPGKLGHYFEKLIQAWIEDEADIQCLAANLPVRDGGRTLGEFDLIVNHQGVTEHWEIAVKFYLAIGDAKHADHWFGPNPTDTLWTKYQRLVTHQLKLQRYPQAQQLLDSHGWHVTRTRCLLKGRLFHPYNKFQSNDLTLPPEVNPDHERGWWIAEEELAALKSHDSIGFIVLPKRYWLATLDGSELKNAESDVSALDISELDDSDLDGTELDGTELDGTELDGTELDSSELFQDSGFERLTLYDFETLQSTVESHSAGTLHVARVELASGREIDRGFIVRQPWLQDVSALLS